jgi:hypothetical protein
MCVSLGISCGDSLMRLPFLSGKLPLQNNSISTPC